MKEPAYFTIGVDFEELARHLTLVPLTIKMPRFLLGASRSSPSVEAGPHAVVNKPCINFRTRLPGFAYRRTLHTVRLPAR